LAGLGMARRLGRPGQEVRLNRAGQVRAPRQGMAPGQCSVRHGKEVRLASKGRVGRLGKQEKAGSLGSAGQVKAPLAAQVKAGRLGRARNVA
jgi:hypothetical protein